MGVLSAGKPDDSALNNYRNELLVVEPVEQRALTGCSSKPSVRPQACSDSNTASSSFCITWASSGLPAFSGACRRSIIFEWRKLVNTLVELKTVSYRCNLIQVMLGDYRHLQRHVRVDGTDGEIAARQDPKPICGYASAPTLDACEICSSIRKHKETLSVRVSRCEMKGTTKTTRIESCSAAVIPDRGRRTEANVKSISATCPGFGYVQRYRGIAVGTEPKLSFTRSEETTLITSRYEIVCTQAFRYNRCGRGPTPDLDKAWSNCPTLRTTPNPAIPSFF